ncbi:hypothetical protein Mal4_48860 [Maioricimonas rarisocia]|uniref:Uncharacterized protein n=1 Tax=Maioricimonas rarisocia TaxID=2528026 RepID=A0A517ZDJ1_9PLAN|nr:hypothetical protein Mal4_48860 [Maioricimonas rarisocia]
MQGGTALRAVRSLACIWCWYLADTAKAREQTFLSGRLGQSTRLVWGLAFGSTPATHCRRRNVRQSLVTRTVLLVRHGRSGCLDATTETSVQGSLAVTHPTLASARPQPPIERCLATRASSLSRHAHCFAALCSGTCHPTASPPSSETASNTHDVIPALTYRARLSPLHLLRLAPRFPIDRNAGGPVTRNTLPTPQGEDRQGMTSRISSAVSKRITRSRSSPRNACPNLGPYSDSPEMLWMQIRRICSGYLRVSSP